MPALFCAAPSVRGLGLSYWRLLAIVETVSLPFPCVVSKVYFTGKGGMLENKDHINVALSHPMDNYNN